MPFGGCKDVDGVLVNSFFSEENLRSALTYRPRPGDIFVATYPKCGTTWMQYIVYCIINKGVPPRNHAEFMLRSPFLELLGAEAAERMQKPGAIKTHMPFERLQTCAHAKYIYVARNPYDCCVSYYYHKNVAPNPECQKASFDYFLRMFLEGRVTFGHYFHNLVSWYEHRHDPNVLFLTFEDLKKDTASCVLKIADFLGKEHGRALREDDGLLRKVLEMTQVENMKKVLNQDPKSLFRELLSLPPDKALASAEVYRHILKDEPETRRLRGDFIRKGVVGDYKSHFSAEQLRFMKDWIAENTQGSDVMCLWKDLDLP
ncbi:sulfotransferase ssu-1-like [Ixodes scapularis]|uniref:sulfotransferase ssu-1-like n=1 Tax=Ixodes scapularis TaxID=6945 RepID=UPI001A9F5ABA|nr:sulfotransferase ssu-1-like [Ixodes scapularis]